MDKLKPIIENKFWILLFLAMLLPTIGWFVASGTFAEEIEKREADLKKAFGDLEFPPEVPNDDWEQSVQSLVEEEQVRLDRTSIALWETQKQVMDWPAGVQEFMVDVPYEGTIPATARENYRRIGRGYEKQLDEIEAILEPYDPLTRTGKVLIDRASYTHVPIGTWKSGPPTSQAMWNAQIDAWLVRSIFQAIKRMNAADEKLSDSTIVQVLELKLRGGIRDYSASAGTAGTGTPGGAGAPSTDDDMYGSGAGGGYGASGSEGGAAGQLNVKLQFDLSDELGPDAGARGGSSSAEGYGAPSTPSGTTEGGAATAAAQGPRRYVDDDESLPFRTRGFVLGVVMHHRYLNDFLAELSGSKWPIQVIRVHQQINNPDSLALVGRTGASSRRGSSTGYGSGAGAGLGSGFGTPGGFGSSYGGEYGPGADPETAGFGGGGLTRPGSSARGMSSGGGTNDLMIQQALSDPHLATVWIGGLITLFKPVDEPEATQPAESEEESVPETSEQADPTAAEAVPEGSTTPDSETEAPADATTNDPNAPTSEGDDPDAPQPATDNTPSAPGDTEPETPPATQESIP